MFVVGYTAGGAPFGVDLWYRDPYIGGDDVSTPQRGTDFEPF